MPKLSKTRILSNLLHTYKHCFREEEQIVYLCDRCVLSYDEHKSLLLLITNDLQDTDNYLSVEVFVVSVGLWESQQL